MTRRSAIALVMGLLAAMPALRAAEREWQTGTWREAKIERPRVLFSFRGRDPNSNVPEVPAAREVRIYVIETDTLRLELRQDATVDTPRIPVLLNEPVTFALEKNTIYVKDENGRQHRLTVKKRTAIPK